MRIVYLLACNLNKIFSSFYRPSYNQNTQYIFCNSFRKVQSVFVQTSYSFIPLFQKFLCFLASSSSSVSQFFFHKIDKKNLVTILCIRLGKRIKYIELDTFKFLEQNKEAPFFQQVTAEQKTIARKRMRNKISQLKKLYSKSELG